MNHPKNQDSAATAKGGEMPYASLCFDPASVGDDEDCPWTHILLNEERRWQTGER